MCGKDIPSELRVFAQKVTRHWRIMGEAIPDIIGQGISTINSMGPFWLIWEYFANFDPETGTITPFKVGLCEPYANKLKEEIIPTLVWWLNCSVPKEDRMVITNLAGEEIFQDMNIDKAEPAVCDKYCAPGWILAPTLECWAAILYAFCNALALSIPEKVRTLAKDLESAKELIAEKIQQYK